MEASVLDPISRLWLALLERVPLNERLVFVVCMYMVSELWYLAIAGAYFLLWKRDWLLKYRIQKQAAMPEPALIKKCIDDVCLRSAVARIPMLFLFYDGYKYLGMPPLATPLPPLSTIAAHWAVALIVNDTAFYWMHRLMHHRVFYKRFHKKHHVFKVNVSVNSEYAEIAEVVLCDVLPTIAGCALLGSHFLVQLGWIALRIWETCSAHSGYALPWCPFSQLALFNGPQVHDFHHSHNVGTYGAMTRFWDAVMGTDRQYQEYAARHHDPHIPNKPPSMAPLPLPFSAVYATLVLHKPSSTAAPEDEDNGMSGLPGSNTTTPSSSPASSPGRGSVNAHTAVACINRRGRSGQQRRSLSPSPIRSARQGSVDSLVSLEMIGSAGGAGEGEGAGAGWMMTRARLSKLGGRALTGAIAARQ